MAGKKTMVPPVQGLSSDAVPRLRQQYGKNIFQAEPQRGLYNILAGILKEPMFILLLIATSLYFILKETEEGLMMIGAMLLVAAISVYQELKSSNAVRALQEYTQPKVTVIRDGTENTVFSEELVPGDIMILEEGMNIPADGIILQQNDFTVNESLLTGESFPVDKDESEQNRNVYQGTVINTGKALSQVTFTGNDTTLGKLGKLTGNYQPPKTLLQVQIGRFVKRLALFGFIAFCIILFINYTIHKEWAASLLFALTLAMSVIPEEIPVAFSSFMALGAFKMSKLGIIVRQAQVVENLGAVSVMCFDKTGTLTENKMQLKVVYDFNHDTLVDLDENNLVQNSKVVYYAMLASESNPFDSMEKAIWNVYTLNLAHHKERPSMIHEYPLHGRPPMMTHVYNINNETIAASKGAAERIMKVCKLDDAAVNKIEGITSSLASKGYRVIAVASAKHTGTAMPVQQDDFNWRFEGLLALYDPPGKNVKEVIRKFNDAKIAVKIITGDHPGTTMNIAAQVGIEHNQHYLTGEAIINMSEDDLRESVKSTFVFARMFPEAKLKVIKALKANGEIVAMTGDGVNDGPALKAADIGIAMGKNGTEIARQASDLVLTDDNLANMIIAVREGRKIFSNLKKAVRYIISIHIPIILVASVPLIAGWKYPNIFTPVHIIFLELIMGPTCSVFFEKEPVEEDVMRLQPRSRSVGLFTKEELFLSVVQGIIIAFFTLILYYYFMNSGSSIGEVRAIVFTTLILSNVFLTFSVRSFTKTLYYTLRYKNSFAPLVIIVSILFIIALYYIGPVQQLFRLSSISAGQFGICLAVAFSSVMWFEIYKTDLVSGRNTVSKSAE